MSEVSSSIGAVGMASPATASGISSEIGSGAIGSTGVGFEGGSPAFSGLGRSDFSSPSMDQSIFTPGETHAFSPSLGISERPAKGFSFGNMEVIASNPSLTPEISVAPASAEASLVENVAPSLPSISEYIGESKSFSLAGTEPMSIMTPVNEGSVSLADLEGMSVIARTEGARFADEAVFEAISEPGLEIIGEQVNGFASTEPTEAISAQEISEVIEPVLEAIAPGVSNESIENILEEMKSYEPLVFAQLESDVQSIEKIQSLVAEVAEPELVSAISASSLAVAAERAGIAKELEIAQAQAAEPQTDDEAVNKVQIQTAAEETENQRVKKEERKKEHVIHESANKAREEEIIKAAEKVVSVLEPGAEIINGEEIAKLMPDEPTYEETSGLIHEEGGKDGSYKPMLQQLSGMRFTSGDQIFAAARKVAEDNTAVEKNVNGTRAKAPQVEKVRRGAINEEIEIYPLAA